MRRALSIVLIATVAAPASAAERPDRGHGIFFNKSGATAESMIAEREACAAIASGTDSQFTPAAVPNLIGLATAGLLSGIAGARMRRVNIENCMVIRGWRLFAFTATEGRAFKAQAPQAQAAELASLVAAEAPARGTLLRTWDNDYANPKFYPKD